MSLLDLASEAVMQAADTMAGVIGAATHPRAMPARPAPLSMVGVGLPHITHGAWDEHEMTGALAPRPGPMGGVYTPVGAPHITHGMADPAIEADVNRWAEQYAQLQRR